jgi:hypothetical protein
MWDKMRVELWGKWMVAVKVQWKDECLVEMLVDSLASTLVAMKAAKLEMLKELLLVGGKVEWMVKMMVHQMVGM